MVSSVVTELLTGFVQSAGWKSWKSIFWVGYWVKESEHSEGSVTMQLPRRLNRNPSLAINNRVPSR